MTPLRRLLLIVGVLLQVVGCSSASHSRGTTSTTSSLGTSSIAIGNDSGGLSAASSLAPNANEVRGVSFVMIHNAGKSPVEILSIEPVGLKGGMVHLGSFAVDNGPGITIGIVSEFPPARLKHYPRTFPHQMLPASPGNTHYVAIETGLSIRDAEWGYIDGIRVTFGGPKGARRAITYRAPVAVCRLHTHSSKPEAQQDADCVALLKAHSRS